MAFYLIGLIMAVIALIGMRKHGRKGILVLALIGLLINSLAFIGLFSLIPVLKRVKAAAVGYSESQLQAMPDVFPGSIKIIDKTRGFRFELPSGFRQFDPNTPASFNIYSYVMVNKDGSNVTVMVQRLNGLLKNKKFNKQQASDSLSKNLPPGSHVEFSEETWQSHTLNCFCTEIPLSTGNAVVWAVQVPLAQEAIQINIGCQASGKISARMFLKQILQSLKGKSNWDSPPASPGE